MCGHVQQGISPDAPSIAALKPVAFALKSNNPPKVDVTSIYYCLEALVIAIRFFEDRQQFHDHYTILKIML